MKNILNQLSKSYENCYPDGGLKEKLDENRPLVIKLGVDPTRPDIHIGHSIVLNQLRQFQDLGHKVILCDFDTMTQNLCSKKLRKLCENQKVDAVIFVHLYGNTDGIIEVKSVCEQRTAILVAVGFAVS